MIGAANGQWVYYCHHAEYLFHPFCETRSVKEMLQFHAEDHRDAMLTCVIDLYADDLGAHPNAVSVERAHLDKSGYYALARKDPNANWEPKERQLVSLAEYGGGSRNTSLSSAARLTGSACFAPSQDLSCARITH